LTPKPPFTPVREVVETVHGVEIHDPYRWLEDTGSEEVRAWVAEQRAHTRAVLDAYPRRAELEERLREVLSGGALGPSWPRGGRRFFSRRTGSMEQAALYLVAAPSTGTSPPRTGSWSPRGSQPAARSVPRSTCSGPRPATCWRTGSPTASGALSPSSRAGSPSSTPSTRRGSSTASTSAATGWGARRPRTSSSSSRRTRPRARDRSRSAPTAVGRRSPATGAGARARSGWPGSAASHGRCSAARTSPSTPGSAATGCWR